MPLPRIPHLAGRLFYRGKDTEGVAQAGESKSQHHFPLWRGEYKVPAGLPGLPSAARQRSHAAGVDELQARQVHDDLRLAHRGRGERSGYRHSVDQVELAAQRDHGAAVTAAGTQVRAEHRYALLAPTARQGPDPAANSRGSATTIRLRELLSTPTSRL